MSEVLALLGANPGDQFFATSGRAEANFQVLLSTYIDWIFKTDRTQLLAPIGEHCSISQGIERLEKLGIIGKKIPLNSYGQVTGAALEKAITSQSALLSLSWANELTGVIQSLEDLASLCRERGIRLHVDATAVIGRLYLQFSALDVDFLTFSSGVLARQGIPLSPLYFDDQPHDLENLLELKSSLERIDQLCLETARIRDHFETELCCLFPSCKIFFKEADRLPDRTAFALPGIHSEMLLSHLAKRHITTSTGKGRLASLLIATGIEPQHAYAAISLPFSHEITEEKASYILQVLAELKSLLSSEPSSEEAKQKGMRLVTSKIDFPEKGSALTCYLLVDESDGIIADCKWNCFGPSQLQKGAEAATQLLVRKSYLQAKHLPADRIEKASSSSDFTSLILNTVAKAANQCMDIPIEEKLLAPQEMTYALKEGNAHPLWLQLPKNEQLSLLEEVIARDIRPYIELDAGGIEILEISHPRIRIAYKGACTTCYSATGATLDAIQNILRSKIHPELIVIPELADSFDK